MRGLLVVMMAGYVSARMWPLGVVHYAINKKDYDVHSQDVIMDTFDRLQREVCLKFFNSPGNYTATSSTKILYISNPDKLKDCPPQQYNFHKSVVDMPIGYRCLDPRNISKIVMDMLRSSIEQTVSPINSYDLKNKFQEQVDFAPRSTLLSADDRNYLNGHYHRECGLLAISGGSRRTAGETGYPSQLSEQNLEFYEPLLWPLGVVMYTVHPDIEPDDPSLQKLQHAMTTIELGSCVVFQPAPPEDQLVTKNFLWFGLEGEDMPALGFQEGNQSLKLSSLSEGAPGHSAHALHALLRALGVPMMSNRFDRDSYVRVDWKNVMPGKEMYLERTPDAAWLRQVPYDMTSATHAPANYMCRRCRQPQQALTVLPLQDHLWQNTLIMGHRTDLSKTDKQTLSLLYGKQCHARALKEKK